MTTTRKHAQQPSSCPDQLGGLVQVNVLCCQAVENLKPALFFWSPRIDGSPVIDTAQGANRRPPGPSAPASPRPKQTARGK